MIWVGLTGGIASGKSTVSKRLRTLGFPVVDADELVREVSQNGTPAHAAIVAAFGRGVVASDGSLDRKKLGEVVFNDRARLSALEAILHPRVRELANAKRSGLAGAGHGVAFYDVPLLFEKSMEPLFDRIAVVVCSRQLQLERLMARNGLSQAEAEARIRAQIPLEEKAKRGHDVIRNDGSLAELESAVDAYLSKHRFKVK